MDRAQVSASDTVTIDSFPFVPNVHTAALPTLPTTLSPSGFNDFGEVVGASGGRVWAWEGSRGLRYFGPPAGYTIANASTVNNRGDIGVDLLPIGANYPEQAAYIDWYGKVHLLRPLSNFTPSCVINGINDSREAIGSCSVGTQHLSTIWTPFGTPVPLEPGGGAPLDGAHNVLTLSNTGYIFGYDTLGETGPTGFVFSPSRVLTTLQPSMFFLTGGMNDNGQPVGAILDFRIPNHGFTAPGVWFTDTATELPVQGVAFAISDDSVVVGITEGSAYEPGVFPFVWTATTGVQRLPGLEADAKLNQETMNTSFLYMNRSRQILGQIVKSDGTVAFVIWTLPATITRGTRPTFAMAR
jgi:hypothetical protein